MDERGQSSVQAVVAAVLLGVGLVAVGGVVANTNRAATRAPLDISAHNAAVEVEATMGYDPNGQIANAYKAGHSTTYNGITIAPSNGSAVVSTAKSVANVPLVPAH